MADSDSKHLREFRRMDDYVRGKLDPKERDLFEQGLGRDPDLQKRTTDHAAFWNAVHGDQEFGAWESLAAEQPEVLSAIINHKLFLIAAIAKGLVPLARRVIDGDSQTPSHTSPQPLEPGRIDRDPPELDFGIERR